MAHARSLVSVVAVVAHSLPAHFSASLHAALLFAAEKLAPSVHAAHARSDVGVPATDWPSPAGHVAHAAQLLCPAEPVNVPLAHAAQTRSLDAVATAAVCWPAAHGARTAAHLAASLLAENVDPTAHAAHTRSADAVPSAALPSPAGHVRHAAHELSPLLAVNVPVAQAPQTRSLDAVAGAVVCSPAAHGARTVLHAAPSLLAENEAPALHAAHTRSDVDEPSVALPCATGHVRHEAHALRPELALKLPDAHAAHTRFLDTVAAAAVCSPAAHGARTVLHAAALELAENVEPALQAAHWRSATAVPSVSSPWPTAHSDHGVQASALPALLLNCPAAHTVHTRSDDSPGAALSYRPALHVVTARHTRSAEPVGAANVYWPDGQSPLCVAHARSLVSVAAVVSHSSPAHTRTALHAAPLFATEKLTPSVHAVHARSDVGVPATDWPSPVGHVAHAAQLLCPAEPVNVPLAHAAQTRSLDAVATAAVCWPAAHGARTAAHLAASLLAENVDPTAHAAHTRSADAVPSAALPSPAGHVRHAAHELSPLLAVNVPVAQAPQTRSLDAVAGAVVCSPAAHGARTVLHAAPSLLAENEAPALHAAHTRSDVDEPSVALPCATGHVRHEAHALRPELALKLPGAQAEHTRSVLAVAAAAVCSPAGHGVRTVLHAAALALELKLTPAWHGLHSRSTVSVPSTDRPSPTGQSPHREHEPLPTAALKCPTAQTAQVKSLDAVAAWSMNWPTGQGVRVSLHSSLLSKSEKSVPAAHARHVRSAVAEPLVD